MVIAVIPSRYHSSRYPGKALVPVEGEPLIGRVVRRVRQSGVARRVLVATDHEGIARAAEAAGAEVWIDDGAHHSGSDRVAAAVVALGLDAEVVLNVQGDEALVSRELLEQAVAALPGNVMGTVAVPPDAGDLEDRDAVKVIVSNGRALEFSRRPLPGCPWIHVGVYAFFPDGLRRFAAMPASPREAREGLEQLRFLDAGLSIGVRLVQTEARSINRPRDLARLEQLLAGAG